MTRDEFRESIFKRDNHKCVICKEEAQDAHHIIERRLFNNGGYYIDNGASLCATHHLEAEKTILSCEEIRKAAKIKKIIKPNHFDNDSIYDKWGNIILPNGQRIIGELFYDESVQKILKDVLDQFSPYVKFPKINHLPWSPGATSSDRIFNEKQIDEYFKGKEIVVTEKLDGENTSMYEDYVHARSVDGRNHLSRGWVKNLHSKIRFDLFDGWRVCGENVYAKHSIAYKNLTSYFYVFSIYDKNNVCLSWDDTREYCNLLGLETVPVLYSGIFDEEICKFCFTGKSKFNGSEQEGYVIRLTDSFHFGTHSKCFAKFVRKNHVTTGHNWMNKIVVKNELC